MSSESQARMSSISYVSAVDREQRVISPRGKSNWEKEARHVAVSHTRILKQGWKLITMLGSLLLSLHHYRKSVSVPGHSETYVPSLN